MNKKQLRRFIKKWSVRIEGCWIWTLTSNLGYGVLYYCGRNHGAHRLSYSAFKGPIEKGQVIRHVCDMKLCVNPDHLLIGSAKDNSIDTEKSLLRRRILNPEKVRSIRAASAKGQSYRSIGRKYKVSATTIREICIGGAWSWVK